MGMYDDIWCRRVLPDGLDGKEHTFQTKDLECNLWKYEITDDGRLLCHIWQEDNSYISNEIKDYHGYITFYHGVRKGVDMEWHEYVAKFTDGKLVELIAKPVKTY